MPRTALPSPCSPARLPDGTPRGRTASRSTCSTARTSTGWKVFLDPEGEGRPSPRTSGASRTASSSARASPTATSSPRRSTATTSWSWSGSGRARRGNSGVLLHVTRRGQDLAQELRGAAVRRQRRRHLADRRLQAGRGQGAGRTRSRPRHYFRMKTDKPVEKKVGEWNKYKITCKGDTVKLEVNGELVNEGKNAEPTKGKIALQSEGRRDPLPQHQADADPLSGGPRMDPFSANPFTVFTLITAPAVLTNAAAVMSLTTSNRLARAIDRGRDPASPGWPQPAGRSGRHVRTAGADAPPRPAADAGTGGVPAGVRRRSQPRRWSRCRGRRWRRSSCRAGPVAALCAVARVLRDRGRWRHRRRRAAGRARSRMAYAILPRRDGACPASAERAAGRRGDDLGQHPLDHLAGADRQRPVQRVGHLRRRVEAQQVEHRRRQVFRPQRVCAGYARDLVRRAVDLRVPRSTSSVVNDATVSPRLRASSARCRSAATSRIFRTFSPAYSMSCWRREEALAMCSSSMPGSGDDPGTSSGGAAMEGGGLRKRRPQPSHWQIGYPSTMNW